MRKLYYLAACLLALCTSCSDWLDVKPKTNVEEEDLFKNEQGFKEALTGIYIKMSETQLYGRELTYGFLLKERSGLGGEYEPPLVGQRAAQRSEAVAVE